ncbi:hypothetical protein SOVF_144220 isoform B [Spinacia oleracea]|nr:hypothetical protein SOVF_144220 isoform B [Spinacia oleracea]
MEHVRGVRELVRLLHRLVGSLETTLVVVLQVLRRFYLKLRKSHLRPKKFGVSALLWYIMRGPSSKFHSLACLSATIINKA